MPRAPEEGEGCEGRRSRRIAAQGRHAGEAVRVFEPAEAVETAQIGQAVWVGYAVEIVRFREAVQVCEAVRARKGA